MHCTSPKRWMCLVNLSGCETLFFFDEKVNNYGWVDLASWRGVVDWCHDNCDDDRVSWGGVFFTRWSPLLGRNLVAFCINLNIHCLLSVVNPHGCVDWEMHSMRQTVPPKWKTNPRNSLSVGKMPLLVICQDSCGDSAGRIFGQPQPEWSQFKPRQWNCKMKYQFQV